MTCLKKYALQSHIWLNLSKSEITSLFILGDVFFIEDFLWVNEFFEQSLILLIRPVYLAE